MASEKQMMRTDPVIAARNSRGRLTLSCRASGRRGSPSKLAAPALGLNLSNRSRLDASQLFPCLATSAHLRRIGENGRLGGSMALEGVRDEEETLNT